MALCGLRGGGWQANLGLKKGTVQGMAIDFDAFYAAIEDEGAFRALPEHIARACEARSAVVIDLGTDGAACEIEANHWDKDLLAVYRSEFMADDPWTAAALTMGKFGTAVALDGVLPPEEFVSTPIYNDLFRPAGDDTARCLGVLPVLGRTGLMMAAHRPARDLAFTPDDEHRMDEVYGHVRRILDLRRVLADQRAQSLRLQDLADGSGQAIVRVDAALRIVALSAPAQALFDKRDGIVVHQGRLGLPAMIEASVRLAVAAAIDRSHPVVRSAFLCPRPSGRQPFRLAVLPAGFDGAAGALIRIDAPVDHPAGLGHQRALRDAYGLSPMEADLAERLAAGQTPEEIAGERGVARETVRTQLRALFAKTGANRQSALVKLVATFPQGSA